MKETRSIKEKKKRKKKKLPALVHSHRHDSLRLGVLEASEPGEDQSAAPRRAFGLIRPFDAGIAQQFNQARRRGEVGGFFKLLPFLERAAEQRRGGRGSVEFTKTSRRRACKVPVPQIRAAAFECNLF